MRKTIGLLIGMILVSGCAETKVTEDYTNIKAVYWHGSNTYSLAIENNGLLEMRYLRSRVKVHTGSEEIKASCEHWGSWWEKNRDRSQCDLWINSVDDLNPSSWDRGKFGRGTISRMDK